MGPVNDHLPLEIRETADKGRGAFTLSPIRKGGLVTVCRGQVLPEKEIPPDYFAMQVGPDLWLCSAGDQTDDCLNHSCDPNVGFSNGDPMLYALRDIQVGEELCWDYSTSIAEVGWFLECCCGSPHCRGIVRSFGELAPADQQRLRPIALQYLRGN
jgi:hypothetical protein